MGDVEEEGIQASPEADVAPAGDGEPEDLFQQEEEERKVKKKLPRSLWKRPPTFVYSDNFGFGVNSYQSMIDYLDVKDSGGAANKGDVHLPMLEERCMTRYHSSKPFKWYQNRDIDKYIDKGEKIRTQIRQNDAIGQSNVLRRTHTNWSMTRKWVQLVKNSSVSDYRKLHKKASEFEDANYRSPTPTPVQYLDYRELTPRPRYLDDLSSEFASVVTALAQSREEYEREMAARREKLRALDEKFENVVDHVNQQMNRVEERAKSVSSTAADHSDAVLTSGRDLVLRNRIRRQEEMKDLVGHVNDLTEIDSARNTLRSSLRSLDEEVLGLSGRVDDMWQLQAAERSRRPDLDLDVDLLRAEIEARKSRSRAPSVYDEDDYEDDYFPRYRRPKEAILMPSRDRVTPRPRVPLMREEIVSDVVARVLYRAGELGPAVGEQRRIRSRARFVNVFKPRPETADSEQYTLPSRTEVNIDHMSKSLATKRAFQRRYDIDDEVDKPASNLNTNAIQDYRGLRVRKPIEQHPSISNRVRHAQSRARIRNSVLGY